MVSHLTIWVSLSFSMSKPKRKTVRRLFTYSQREFDLICTPTPRPIHTLTDCFKMKCSNWIAFTQLFVRGTDELTSSTSFLFGADDDAVPNCHCGGEARARTSDTIKYSIAKNPGHSNHLNVERWICKWCDEHDDVRWFDSSNLRASWSGVMAMIIAVNSQCVWGTATSTMYFFLLRSQKEFFFSARTENQRKRSQLLTFKLLLH